ncbi:MAG: hypothetical protein ACFFBD_19840, partial [Candidatus Hodarchaeota archaeon]
ILMREIQNFLLKYNYIPDTWLKDNRKSLVNTYIVPKVDWILPSVINPIIGDYKAYRCIRLQIVIGPTLSAHIVADIETRFRKDKTLWETLNDTLRQRNTTLEALQENPKLQSEINSAFWRRISGLSTKYSLQKEGGTSYSRYKFSKFEFNHSVDDKEFEFDYHGRKVTIREYHELRGRKVEPKEQILVKVKKGQRVEYLPPSLLHETTDFRTLERLGLSQEGIEKAKLNPMERFLLLNLLMKPLFDEKIVSLTPQISNARSLGNVAKLQAAEKSINLSGKKMDLFKSNNKIELWRGIDEILALYSEDVTGSYEIGIKKLNEETEKILSSFSKSNGSHSIKITQKTFEGEDLSSKIKAISDLVKINSMNKQKSIIIIYFDDSIDQEGKIRADLKKKLTFFNEIPTQFIKLSTIRKTRNYQREEPRAWEYLAQMLLLQILIKTGNLPYVLSLDRDYPDLAFIGFDRSYDTQGDRVSVSAGVAAFGTTGEFIAGISSSIDSEKSDYMPIPELTRRILPKIKEK